MDTRENAAAMRSALAHAVGELCEQERGEKGLAMEPSAVATLAYVVENYVKVLAVDLPAFARHAKRSTIQVEDVLLMTRHSPDLADKMNDFVDARDLRGKQKKRHFVPDKEVLSIEDDDED